MRITWNIPIILALFSLALTGCGIAEQLSPAPTLAPSPVSSSTPEARLSPTPAVENCAFVWSNRSLPEISLQLNQAFRQSGMAGVEAQASAYGEDCIDQETNQVVRFSAMQTDFYISVTIEQVDDPQALGKWIENILRVLNSFQPGQVPGPNPGMVEISFNDGSQITLLRFRRTDADSLIKEGLGGSALFEALQQP